MITVHELLAFQNDIQEQIAQLVAKRQAYEDLLMDQIGTPAIGQKTVYIGSNHTADTMLVTKRLYLGYNGEDNFHRIRLYGSRLKKDGTPGVSTNTTLSLPHIP